VNESLWHLDVVSILQTPHTAQSAGKEQHNLTDEEITILSHKTEGFSGVIGCKGVLT